MVPLAVLRKLRRWIRGHNVMYASSPFRVKAYCSTIGTKPPPLRQDSIAVRRSNEGLGVYQLNLLVPGGGLE